MKRLKMILVLAAVTLVSQAPAFAQAVDDSIPEALKAEYRQAANEGWVYLFTSKGSDFWMQPKTVRRTPKGTSTYWVIAIPEFGLGGDWTKARRELIKQNENNPYGAGKYNTYLSTKFQYEVSCSTGRFRMLRMVEYNEAGEVIFSDELENEKMREPVPDSNGEVYAKMLCNPRLRKTFRQFYLGE